jgi:hypothetical protein
MAMATTIPTARVRRHTSLPELLHQKSILPSSLSVFSKAESPLLRYPGETLVANNPSAAQNNVSSSTPDLPHATPGSFACNSKFYYRPKCQRQGIKSGRIENQHHLYPTHRRPDEHRRSSSTSSGRPRHVMLPSLIFTTLTRSSDDKAPKTATLNIAATQRLVLAYQQRKISKLAAKLYSQSISDIESDAVCVELRELIHKYCESPTWNSSRICSLTLLLHSGDMVCDLEYMQLRAADCGEHDEDDPFYLESSRRIDRLAMELAELIPNHVLPDGDLPIARDHDHPTLPGIPRTIAIKANKSKHLLLRFSMASAGGLFLIVPVLVMANIPGRTSSLVTTCIAMLIFAIGVTFGTDLKADQVLGATAAYAAVLVVFVGTSLANTGV